MITKKIKMMVAAVLLLTGLAVKSYASCIEHVGGQNLGNCFGDVCSVSNFEGSVCAGNGI